MFYVFFASIFILLHTFLILSTNIYIWPEFYLFSWLVQKGLLPYRDFFDHHGFILYYLFAPLTKDHSLSLFKTAFYMIQLINLLLVLKILKNTTNKLGYVLGGFLFVLISFFVVENVLWYELVITTIYLCIYLILISGNFKYKNILSGILISATSFIKPMSALIIVPVVVKTKSLKPIIILILSWLGVFTYFYLNNDLHQFLESNFAFNKYLVTNLHDTFFSDFKFLASSIFLTLFSVYLAFKDKKIKKIIPLILILLLSLIFFFTGYWRVHLVPITTFFALIVGFALGIKETNVKKIFIALLLIYTFLLTRKDIYHRKYLNTERIPYAEDKRSKDIVQSLSSIKTKKFYLLTNHAEIYFYMNQLPPTYFPLKFPKAEGYFTDYENRMISDLIRNKVEYVVFPKPIEADYENLKTLQNYITSHYKLILDTDGFQILEISPGR